MLITHLELFKFIRFSLNQIDTFKYSPEKLIQIILGSNGSGKSSLIELLTPLPPDSNDFSKDGYKVVHITKSGNSYVLKSSFNPTRHNFLKNDEELNPGGTITVFRELVKIEFGITNEIHDLMIGRELFHNMSFARRREWFTKLSDTNYDYALKVYNKLRERSRDITGALKLAKNRYTNEAAKVISVEEESKLKEDAELTHKELNLLIENSAPLDNSVNYYKNEKTEKLIELEKLSDKLLRMRCVAPYGTYAYGINPNGMKEVNEWREPIKVCFNSVEEIDVVVNELSHKVTAIDTLINTNVEEYSRLTEKINILIKTGNEGIKELNDRVMNLNMKECSLRSYLKLGILIEEDPLILINALDSVYENISNIALTIPENRDKKFSRDKLNELKTTIVKYKDEKIQLISDVSKLEARIIHLETHKANGSIACPSCNHKWIPGYSDEHLNQLVIQLTTSNENLNIVNKKIEGIEKDIEANEEYSKEYNEYVRCITNWPVLKPIWDKLIDNDFIRNRPRVIPSMLDKFKIDLDYELKIKNVKNEIVELEELIKLAEAVGDANLNELQNRLVEVTTFIDNKTAELNKLRKDISGYVEYKKELIEAFKLESKIHELIKHVETANKNMVEMMRRETLSHCIRQLQSSLALKETTLNAINLQKGIIEDLKKQIDILTIEEESSKLLVKTLSPTEGLIASGMLGFIKAFIGQMNNIIKKIWSYPLRVYDCGCDDGELDFKFQLDVENGQNIVPDIKLGSAGMKEVVDLAFKIVAMKYLHIANGPLVLDEFSKNLDTTHRVSAMNNLKLLMDNGSFSQLFMVSHDYEVYGIFTNADIVVLDSRNITVNSKYNECVVIN